MDYMLLWLTPETGALGQLQVGVLTQMRKEGKFLME